VYFIIRDKKASLAGLSPRERHAAIEAHDKAESMSLREAAAERRKHWKWVRLGKLAGEKGIERGVKQAREQVGGQAREARADAQVRI